jgi:hypothetical protein
MKKIYPSLLGVMLIVSLLGGTQAMAQVEKCGSAALHNYMMQTDPGYVQKMLAFENQVAIMQNTIAQRTSSVSIYKIPVVVHVMHKGEPVGSGTNVSDVAIENAIRSLNEIYRKVPGSRGDGLGVDVEIEFALAVRDPSGNCTNGIVRVDMTGNSTYMSSGVMRSSAGITDASLKAISFWNKTKYYNIWLVSEIDNNFGGSGIQGYAYFASSHGTAQDGAVMLANNFIGGTSTTCAHELGHALNLYHTFEGDGGQPTPSCPSVTNGCGSGVGDCCGDTPPHIQSSSDCVTGTNACTGTPRDLFIHNYMDYSSDICQNMFTPNQKTRMVTALTTTRASFLTPDNGGTNDALTPVAAPTADFFVSGPIVCGAGQTINLIDKSNCVPNSYIPASLYPNVTYAWTISNGTTTYTSSAQNPVITIANAGTYSVTLTVTNALGSNTVTKPNALMVMASGAVAACVPSSANVGNFGQTICDVQFNNINSPSATISNAGYTDLTCTNNTTVTAGSSYPLAITALSSGGTENFEVYIDYNNNGVFTNPAELVFSGSNPASSTLSYTTSVAIPTTAVQNTLLRMRVIGESSGSITAAKRSCSSQFVVGDIEDYGVYIKPVACAAPSITATNGASRCGTGTATINATASAGTISWYATSSGTTSVATGTAYATPSLSTTTTYYVEATNSGCTTPVRTAVTVTVNAAPALTLTPTTATICSGGTTTLTASGATTYTWLPSGSGASSAVSPASTTVYTVTGSNGTCVGSAVMATVAVSAIPVITVTPTNTTICNGASATLTASGATTYTWLPSGSGASNVVNPSSTTVYTVTGSNGSCNSTSKTVTVTVNASPSVTITPTNTTICSGGSTTLTASGATTYTWLPSGSGTSNVVSPASTTVYTLTGSNGGCASVPKTATITVNAIPVLTVTPTSTTICSGASTTLTANGATTYTWLPSGSGASNVVSPVSTTVYTVTGSNGSCTGAAKTVTVTTGTTPVLTVTPTGTTICSGASTTLTASGATTYTWLPSGSAATNVVSPASTTVYSVSGSTGGCTSALRTVTVTVTTTPTTAVSASSSTICAGQTTTLTASGATGYAWLPGGQTTAAINVNPTITTSYTVTGSNGSCSSTGTISVTVSTVPTVTASVTNTTICSGTPVTVNVGGATSFTWSPSGSGSSSVLSPAATTVYSITGANGSCTSAVRTVTITVNTTPTVAISTSSSTICAGQTTTLTATGATSYAWLPGGQTTGVINVNPSTTTAYTVTGSNGSCSSSRTISILVNAVPTVTASVTNTTICSGTPVTVNVGGATSYTWSPSGSGTSSALSPAATTIYSITGSNGSCTGAVRTVTITVTTTPTVGVTASSSAICSGQTVTLTASGATSYAWLPGGQTTAAVNVNPSTNTTYTVTGTNGSCSTSTMVTVNVTATPTIATSITNTTICSGTPVSVTASGAISYTWSPSGSGSMSVFTPTSTTVYTVAGTFGGCTGVPKTFTINVTTSVALNVSASSTTLCAGQTTTLTAAGASSYAWQPGSQTTASIAVSPSTTTTYTVTGTNGGCSSQQSMMIFVTQVPAISSSITNTTVCSGMPVTVNVSGGTSYVWTPSGSGSSSTFAPLATTAYTVTSPSACGNGSVTFTLNVVSAPVITATGPSTICAGATTTLNASGATSYIWLPGTGLSSTSGATVTAFPASSIVYTVTGSNGVCEASQMVPVSVDLCVGLEDLAANSSIAVYPNPSTGLFTISIPGNAGKLDVEVMNTLGQTVVKESSKNPEALVVDMNDYGRGVYYLKIQLNQGSKLVKVVLE